MLKEEQQRTGIKLLWATACLFINPRFVHGAATSPNADVFVYSAAQVKKAIEVAHELGAEGYVFWGGREGHSSLWNTDMKREVEHLAKFMHMAVEYKKQIGFKGAFYIEPKPKEPTKHQYDFDAATCLNFLREYWLLEHFKLNLGEMFDYMPGFKRLMDTAEPGTIDELCRRFAGTISCCSRLLVGNFSTGKQPEE